MTLDIEALNNEKKEAKTVVKSLQKKIYNNLTNQNQKTLLTSDLDKLQTLLSEDKITLDEFNNKKADVDKQISDCDAKLADKQQKPEKKHAELQTITDKMNYYDWLIYDLMSHRCRYLYQRYQNVHLALAISTIG